MGLLFNNIPTEDLLKTEFVSFLPFSFKDEDKYFFSDCKKKKKNHTTKGVNIQCIKLIFNMVILMKQKGKCSQATN